MIEAYKKPETETEYNTLVDETQNMFRMYSSKRENWATHAQEDREFRLGRQWTAEQRATLEERGQAPVVVNRIHPAVESAKALLTSKRPSFRVSPREDSDNKVAQVLNGLLEYIWQISEGDTALRNVVDDYYVTGLGALLVYQDPMRDNGKGEVIIKDIDPLDLYIDPNSRDRMGDDAESIIISRMYTKNQAMKLYPMYRDAIAVAESDLYSDRPSTGREDDGELVFPEDTDTETRGVGWGENDEYIRGYERYMKVQLNFYRVFERWSGAEHMLEEGDEYEGYKQERLWKVNGQIVEDAEVVAQEREKYEREYEIEVQKIEEKGRYALARMGQEHSVQFIEAQEKLAEEVQMGNMVEERMQLQLADLQKQQQDAAEMAQKQFEDQMAELAPPSIEEITKEDLLREKKIDIVKISQTRIKMCVIMGDKYLYGRVLPTENYPIVLIMNQHTRTPYPIGDVRMVKGMQEYINKTRSLIIAHATTSTNVKILVPSGSVDMREFEKKWAQPGVAIEVDMDNGAPQPIQPTPLPNELYQNENSAKNDIDHQLGLYELMMGNSSVAPHTYKATVSLDEFGQRKIRSKLMDIEAGLKRAGEVAIPMCQQLYQSQKLFRLINPNNSMSEFMMNKRMVDDKTGEINILNNIGVGKYDVIVVTGSTLPTNRYAQLEMYMDAYEKGIIDRQEVLKKTEVFDIEGVMERTDTVAKLEQALEQAQEQIKELSGDLQTREREVYHSKQKAELEKFKGSLDAQSNKAKAAGTVFEKRLQDATGQIAKEVREASKDKKPDTSTKE
tara:strand:- start:1728 stop:4091 length:2364 start_codon:yes stop_codon:yes gene_type:complete